MVTAVAPTMPVDAASNAPTSTAEMASPPRNVPNSRPMRSSRSSAMRDCSSITPMKMNSGTASNTGLVMMPKMRSGSAPRMLKLIVPVASPMTAKASEMPASVSATG